MGESDGTAEAGADGCRPLVPAAVAVSQPDGSGEGNQRKRAPGRRVRVPLSRVRSAAPGRGRPEVEQISGAKAQRVLDIAG